MSPGHGSLATLVPDHVDLLGRTWAVWGWGVYEVVAVFFSSSAEKECLDFWRS